MYIITNSSLCCFVIPVVSAITKAISYELSLFRCIGGLNFVLKIVKLLLKII